MLASLAGRIYNHAPQQNAVPLGALRRDRYCRQMSGELESENPAVVARIAGTLSRIASGAIRPREGLAQMVAEYHAAPQADATRFVGSEYGIQQLVGYFYSYDDLEERPSEVSFMGLYGPSAFPNLDSEVVKLCKEWLRARYNVSRSGA